MMASIKLLIFLKTHSQAKGAPDIGLASLRDLPDIEKLEDAGLLQRSANEIELDGVLRMRDRDAIEFVEAVDDEED